MRPSGQKCNPRPIQPMVNACGGPSALLAGLGWSTFRVRFAELHLAASARTSGRIRTSLLKTPPGLKPRGRFQYARPDSNRRPLPPEGSALSS